MEKCKRELLRCLKCHGWNPMVTECMAGYDACSTCTHHHRMFNCSNLDQQFCTPCSMSSHASWDRNCPVFQRKCDEMNVRMEENQMPYFPIPEVWMQVKEPPNVISNPYSHMPGPAYCEGNQVRFRQTTITPGYSACLQRCR